jgi:hypothetical protein
MASRDDLRRVPLYDLRLGDLRQWHILEATCFRCRTVSVVGHSIVTRGRRETERLLDQQRRLRCSRCGNATDNRISVRMADRN